MPIVKHEVVLVTGATGYIGANVVLEAVRKGYRVRGTVRDLESEHSQALRELCPEVELVKADLLEKFTLVKAMKGVHAVIHVAAPYFLPMKEELIEVHTEGTENVFIAAAINNVKRIVMTSSIATCGFDTLHEKPSKPEEWADEAFLEKNQRWYTLAKTRAEKIAWKLAEVLDIELTTILPGIVLGPPRLAKKFEDWMVKLLLDGPMLNLDFYTVDVRDVAEAHVACLSTTRHKPPGADRVLAYGANLGSQMYLRGAQSIIDDKLGDEGFSAPMMLPVPDWLGRHLAPQLLAPRLGKKLKDYDKIPFLQLLKAGKPIPVDQQIHDMVVRMVELDMLQPPAAKCGFCG